MTGARDISRLAWSHYCGAPLSIRLLMTLRPRICPLDVVAEAVPRQSRVLDVGCGAGLLLHWLASARGLAGGVGVDTSPKMIAAAAADVAEAGVLRFECQGPEEPWPAGPFDVVTVVNVLHHVPAAGQRAFIGRLAAGGAGLAIVKDIDTWPRWKVWMNALHDLVMTRRWVHVRSMAEVRIWLEEDGWRVIRADRVDRLWYSHYLIVAERQVQR